MYMFVDDVRMTSVVSKLVEKLCIWKQIYFGDVN